MKDRAAEQRRAVAAGLPYLSDRSMLVRASIAELTGWYGDYFTTLKEARHDAATSTPIMTYPAM